MVAWSCYLVDYDLDRIYWVRVALGADVSLGKDCNYQLEECVAHCGD